MGVRRVLVKKAVRKRTGGGWLNVVKNLAPLVIEVIRIVLTKK